MNEGQMKKGILVGLACITFLLFLSVLGFEFVRYDDQSYVVQNPHVLAGFTLDTLKWAFTTFDDSLWAPLMRISHTLDVVLYGIKPAGHHFTNLVLHLLNTLLLFLFLNRATGAVWPSSLVAALFAWHPLHVEPVAWVASRKDVLSGLFTLLTLLCYDNYVKSPSMRKMFIVAICLVLSLMAKPMAVTLPCVLLLLDYWPYERIDFFHPRSEMLRRLGLLVQEKLLLFVPVAVVCVLTVVAEQETIAPLDRFPLDERVANSLVAYATYLFKTFIPYPLWIPYTAQPDFAPLWKALCAAILLLAITGGVVALRRSRYLLVGWLWFLGTLVPVIGMVPFGHHIMADRFTYFPLIGLFMIWAWGLAALVAGRPSFKKPLVAAVAVVLAVCSVLAWYQVQHWRTTGTLFSHAIAVDADNYPALCNLGRYFVEQGDPKQAVQYFQRAHALKQEDMDIKNDLGVVYLFTGRYEEAAKIFREVLQKNPNDPDVHVHLGAALLSLRDYEAARAEAYKALELDPNTVRARKLLQGIAQEMRR